MTRMRWFWVASCPSLVLFRFFYINAFVKNSHNWNEWMLQLYRRNSEGTSKQFTETQFSSGKGKRQNIIKHTTPKRLRSIITYFYKRSNFQVLTHSYNGMNEALVQGVGFSHRNRKSITKHKNAGSCDLPLDLKGESGRVQSGSTANCDANYSRFATGHSRGTKPPLQGSKLIFWITDPSG